MKKLCLPRASLGLFAFLAWSLAVFALTAPVETQTLEIVKRIYEEVKDMEKYPGEDFVRGEFFVGPDDDDTNKDIHVSIVIQRMQAAEKMKIQVTFMERSPGHPQVSYAKSTRLVVCLVVGKTIAIDRSDFSDQEMKRLAPEILRAVRDKKKLLQQWD